MNLCRINLFPKRGDRLFKTTDTGKIIKLEVMHGNQIHEVIPLKKRADLACSGTFLAFSELKIIRHSQPECFADSSGKLRMP